MEFNFDVILPHGRYLYISQALYQWGSQTIWMPWCRWSSRPYCVLCSLCVSPLQCVEASVWSFVSTFHFFVLRLLVAFLCLVCFCVIRFEVCCLWYSWYGGPTVLYWMELCLEWDSESCSVLPPWRETTFSNSISRSAWKAMELSWGCKSYGCSSLVFCVLPACQGAL